MNARTLPEYLWVTSAGELCDNRPSANVAAGIGTVVRTDYARHHSDINTGAQLRATLRAGQYAWPGGYALCFVTSDGETLSWAAVLENLALVIGAIREYNAGNSHENSGWRVVACQSTETDDEAVYCAHTGEVIE